MIIYFIQALSLWATGIGRHVNKSFNKRKKYVVMAFMILFVVAALRKYTVGADLVAHYASRFETFATLSWSEVIEYGQRSVGYGMGYCIYNKLVAMIFPNLQFFIAITSAFIIGVHLWFFYKNSVDLVMSINLFVLYCINYMYFTMIRQAMAVSFVLIGYEFLKRRDLGIQKYLVFTGFVLVGASFHTSALLCLIMIPFDFLEFDRKHIIYTLIATAIAMIFYSQIYSLVLRIFGSMAGNYERYVDHAAESAGNLNKQSLLDVFLCSIPFVLGYYSLVLNKNRNLRLSNLQLSLVDRKTDSFLLYMALGTLVCRALVFRMNIIYRMSYYFVPFTLLLIPRAVSGCKPKKRTMIRFILYVVFAAYFVLITWKYAQAFYGVVPYQFFWE